MFIGIHDSEMEHFNKGTEKFPNYALMKISAFHKKRGDTVEWFLPMNASLYDRVYSSKVFEWTPENPYLPQNTIKGGMGYGLLDELADEIENEFPDYSLYPECDYAIGFITRGCINKCPWCGVPKKEGYIHPYRHWRDIVRKDTQKLVLMDNNILASPWGIENLKELADTEYKIDINQAMDARLVTAEIADILARLKWIKYIRFSCDQKNQIEAVKKAVGLLANRGVKASKIFLYLLITKDIDAVLNRIYAMRELGSVTIYGMPERNPSLGIMPEKWQMRMANQWIYSGKYRTMDWDEWADYQGIDYPKKEGGVNGKANANG